MALYKLTVVKLSGATEIRYTDRMRRIGGTVMIDSRRALVVSRHEDVGMRTRGNVSSAR